MPDLANAVASNILVLVAVGPGPRDEVDAAELAVRRRTDRKAGVVGRHVAHEALTSEDPLVARDGGSVDSSGHDGCSDDGLEGLHLEIVDVSEEGCDLCLVRGFEAKDVPLRDFSEPRVWMEERCG